ncbi:MAG: hypothetical protein SGJ05_02030 [bacterium]|nr:hypothetical protein [bacterium]
MELIYAILIFFGAMLPNEYNQTASAQANGSFNPQVFQSTIQSNQPMIDFIIQNPEELERIRTLDIDRTED